MELQCQFKIFSLLDIHEYYAILPDFVNSNDSSRESLLIIDECSGNSDIRIFLLANVKSKNSKPGETVHPIKPKEDLSLTSAANQSPALIVIWNEALSVMPGLPSV